MTGLALLAVALAAPPSSDVVVSWDLESDDGGLVSSGETMQWAWGEVTSGPGAGATGSRAWGTVLDGSYLNDATDYLTLPATDLSGTARPVLVFKQWYEIDPSGDFGQVERFDGADWVLLEPVYGYPTAVGYTGSSNGWVESFYDLSLVTDASELRFAFSADSRRVLAGWYVDDLRIVDDDPVPPRIDLLQIPEDTQDLTGPYPVIVSLEDDEGSPTGTLRWWTDADADAVQSTALSDLGDGRWEGSIPAQAPDTVVSWVIEATDGVNDSALPDVDDPGQFRVYLAAPTGLTGPEDRVVGLEATLNWDIPESPHPILGYVLYRDGVAVAECEGTSLDAPLAGPLDVFQVSARYDVGEGDLSDPLYLRSSVPSVAPLEPDAGWQGARLRVNVFGDYLLFTQDDASLDLGEGVSVEEVSVVDANRAVFTLNIADDAPIGLRDGALTSGDVRIPLSEAFEVIDGEDRPRLVLITPDSLTRGQQETITVLSNSALDGTSPSLYLGEGVIIGAVVVQGNQVQATVAVASDAETGLRAVTLDDGEQLLEGVELRVRAAPGTPSRNCATAPGGALSLGWLAALAAALRRRPQGSRGRPSPSVPRSSTKA